MEKKYYLGVDIGGTNTNAVVIDQNNQILGASAASTGAGRGFERVISDIAATARAAVASANLSESDIESAGFGVPGAIDYRSGRVVYCDNLGWRDIDVAAALRGLLNMRVHIANDADCALLAEARAGAARRYRDCVMLTLGTGVGGAVMLGGELYSGGDGFGCEPGHMTLVVDGLECGCGRRGCLECYCSATALIRDARAAAKQNPSSLLLELAGGDIERINGSTPFEAARAGDKTAKDILARYIHYLAAGISGYISAIRPEAFIIGGGLSHAGDELFVPLREAVRLMVYFPEVFGVADILPAALGGEAGALGAAMLGRGR